MRGCEGRLRGKGEGAGVAGGEGETLRRIWFPSPPELQSHLTARRLGLEPSSMPRRVHLSPQIPFQLPAFLITNR